TARLFVAPGAKTMSMPPRPTCWPLASSLVLLALTAVVGRAAAEEPTVEGVFIEVKSPIDSKVYGDVMDTTTRVVERFRAERQNPPGGERELKIVYDFNPNNRPAETSTNSLGPCFDLAQFLLGQADIQTIAFVHDEVSGHSVLPVLACKEVV